MRKRILRSKPNRNAVAREPSGPRWNMQEAKTQFEEVFKQAITDGPQLVARQDDKTVVVVSEEDFQRLTAQTRQPLSLVQFFAESPLAKSGIKLERETNPERTEDL